MKATCKTPLSMKIGKSFSGLLKLSGVKTVLRFLLGNFFSRFTMYITFNFFLGSLNAVFFITVEKF